MMPTNRLILTLILLYLPFCVCTQTAPDSSSATIVESTTVFYNENQLENNRTVSYLNDSLTNFHIYQNVNFLGNSGLANNRIFLSIPTNNTSFLYANNFYSQNFISPQNIRYYDTKKPHTDLFYVAGSKKEQLFSMVFSYNIKNNWNTTISFKRIRSDGFYLRQNTNDNFLSLSSNYTSTNNRYVLLTNLIYNGAKNAENGGIIGNLSENISPTPSLSSAERSTVNKSIYLKHYFNFGEKSADSSQLNKIAPNFQLQLSSHYDEDIYTYEDNYPQSGYYPEIYFDSTKTFDSTNVLKINNQLCWKRVDNGKHSGAKDMFGVSIGIKHQLIQIKQYELSNKLNDTKVYTNIAVNSSVYNTYSTTNLWWNITGDYTLSGYNEKNYFTEASIKKNSKDSIHSLNLKLSDQKYTPDYIYNHYTSNHYQWENNFKNIRASNIAVAYTLAKYKLNMGAIYTYYQNLVYFDYSALPIQYTSPISVSRFYLKKDFSFYNFHIDNCINYQKTPKLSLIRLPELTLNHSVYYASSLFKKAMDIQIGASVFYTSEYFADNYLPNTAQFYLQYKTTIGNYPYINFFINASVKTVRIFFKIDHLNSGWGGYNYTFVPGYPINTRAFKLGISWRFFD